MVPDGDPTTRVRVATFGYEYAERKILKREVAPRRLGAGHPALRRRIMGEVEHGSGQWLACKAASKMATARVQPADAPRILCGKQLMKNPVAGSASRL